MMELTDQFGDVLAISGADNEGAALLRVERNSANADYGVVLTNEQIRELRDHLNGIVVEEEPVEEEKPSNPFLDTLEEARLYLGKNSTSFTVDELLRTARFLNIGE